MHIISITVSICGKHNSGNTVEVQQDEQKKIIIDL